MKSKKTQKELKENLEDKVIPWSGVITNIQGRILEGLARYRFLSLTQMLELADIGTTQYAYIWKQAKSLTSRGKPLMFAHSYGSPEPKKGKVEDIYYLLPKGRDALIEHFGLTEEDIKIPKGQTMAYKDYHHRKRQIDFQIRLDKWADSKELDIPYFDCYFDKKGNNRISKNLKSVTSIKVTETKYLIADGAFEVVTYEGDRKLYVFEFANGKNTKDILKAIHQHAQAMMTRATHRKYNLDENKSYKVVWLFHYPTIKDAVIKRIKQEGEVFNFIHKYFIVNSLDNLKKPDFFESWETIRGEKVPFYE